MSTSELKTSSASIESALSETMKRINENAIRLFARRAEINWRIRSLQQVMRGLQELAAKGAFPEPGAQSTDAAPAKEQPMLHHGWLRCTGGEIEPGLLSGSKHATLKLARACRIALMEAGGAAPLAEIHARIDRRGSFSFADGESPDEAILCALNAMTDDGELRRLEGRNQFLWQRTGIGQEIDTSPEPRRSAIVRVIGPRRVRLSSRAMSSP
jgi:hypothetical protein